VIIHYIEFTNFIIIVICPAGVICCASFGFAVIRLITPYPLSRFPQGGKAGAPSPLGEGWEGGYMQLNDNRMTIE